VSRPIADRASSLQPASPQLRHPLLIPPDLPHEPLASREPGLDWAREDEHRPIQQGSVWGLDARGILIGPGLPSSDLSAGRCDRRRRAREDPDLPEQVARIPVDPLADQLPILDFIDRASVSYYASLRQVALARSRAQMEGGDEAWSLSGSTQGDTRS
jgi:hypothetical protein